MKQLNLEQFETLLTSGEEFLLEVGASWCPPCKVLLPILEKLATEVDYQVVKMDIDEVPELKGRYSIKNVPTVIHFKEGKVHNRGVGIMSIQKLKELAL